MNKFEQLGLSESLLKAILDLGFENPTEVQEKAIPLLLEKDTDMVALAQTGTGKTAAFGFPLIQKIDANNRNTQALILSPTRELCLQITNDIKNYSKYEKGVNVVAVYGGASITEQARDIKRGAQIIVATPGRMQDMINRGLVNISQINYCILDEADDRFLGSCRHAPFFNQNDSLCDRLQHTAVLDAIKRRLVADARLAMIDFEDNLPSSVNFRSR